MRHHLSFVVNGKPVRAEGRAAFSMLAPFLRREQSLTGTKIACSEGACGACSVLIGRPQNGFDYAPVNACIFPLWACDGAHIITVEGLNGPAHIGGADSGELSPVQQAMVECHGAQCGFCTPGIVVTLTAFHEKPHGPDLQSEVQSALEGNLCRCTGYTPILEAGAQVETSKLRPLSELYPPGELLALLSAIPGDDVAITAPADALEEEQTLFSPRDFVGALRWKAAHPDAIVVSGNTEIGVAMSVKGFAPREVLSLSRVDGLDDVSISNNVLTLGARASWTQVAEAVRDGVPEFAALLKRWGSPQLRNAGTVAGNIVRASPISDSLPFLLVCDAQLQAESTNGTRLIPIAEFLNGDRLRPDELLRRVLVPLPNEGETLRLFKVAKRRAFDRSIVSGAFVLKTRENHITDAKVAFGGVADTALRLSQTEAFLRDKPPESATWREAGQIAQGEISPISNASASREYRRQLAANLFRRLGCEL